MNEHMTKVIDFAGAHRVKKAVARRAEFARMPHGPGNERLYRLREIEEVLPALCAELTAHHLAHLRESDVPRIGAMLKDFATEGRHMGFTARQWLSADHLATWVGGRLGPALAGLARVAHGGLEIEARYTKWRTKAESLRKRVKATPAGPAKKQVVILAPEIARAEALLRDVLVIVEACENAMSSNVA